MHKRSFVLILTLIILSAGSRWNLVRGDSAPSSAGLHLLRSDASGIVLDLSTPAYELALSGPFHRLTVPGYDVTQQAGQPQVPLVGALLGVPPDAGIELRVLADDAIPLPAHHRLSPAPRPAPLTDDLQPGELTFKPDPIAYAADGWYPPAAARIAGEAWLRDQRIVRVELYPFQYNPAREMLLWHRRLRVEVRFTGLEREKGEKGKGEEGGVRDSPFESVLRGVLLNYEEARAWRGRPLQHAARNTQYVLRTTQYPRYKIVVDHDALYRLSYGDLRAAGLDVDAVDPRTFRMTSQGRDVAIYVAGEEDGRFDPGDSITFYGQKFRGDTLAALYADGMADWLTLCPACELAGMFEKYTDENVYWLTAGGEPGLRMATIDGAPTDTALVPATYRATVHAEESHAWYTHHFTNEDTWFWERIQPGPTDTTRTFTTTLTAVATGPFTATVRASVVSRSINAGHHTQFYLNGGATPLDDAIWDGKGRYTFEAEIDQSRLREGVNELDFVVLFNGAFEDMYFDWFEVEYEREFRAQGDELVFGVVGPHPPTPPSPRIGRRGAPGAGRPAPLPLPSSGKGAGGGGSTRTAQSDTWQYELANFLSATVAVYDITDPLSPKRMLNPRVTPAGGTYTVTFEARADAGTRFLAVGAGAVRSPKQVSRYEPPDFVSTAGADYVFITHHDFITATQTLADYRASQGLSTMVVDIADLYNEFNFGIYHPIAIRNFLAYAFDTWQTHPSYVLLVGDGHWNLKGYSGYEASPIYMPPNLAFVDPWQGEVDSTNLLAAVVGDDILPDLSIGRLPVNSVDELNAAIAKIITYEQAEPADWQRRVLFVADNVPDSAGDFVGLANDIVVNHLPGDFEADRIYLNDYCGPPANPPAPCPAMNAAIVDELNQIGALFVNYVGHASVDRWAHERIFVNDDILSLSNGDRLPVVLSMTCLDGYYYYPGRPSLAEELIRADGHGAVSTFSPTGLGVATGHHILQRRFYDAVFQDGVRTLGPATVAAKLALYASGGNYDLIHTFTIFGDPALRLKVPASNMYLSLIAR